jgi:crotonobetainyl-CoA:carnitine CoA-transferase CaiB-like acyl-CoA transferase
MFHANIRGMGGMLPEELLEKLRKEFSMAEDLPAYGSFPARDGWIVISAFSEGEWRRLVECIGREELRDKKYSNFFTRMKHEKKIREIIREWTADRTRKEIEDELIKWRIPCGPVLELGELPQNPQLLAREMFKELQHPKLGKIKVPGVVLKLSESSGEIFAPAPELGEHNEEVYSSILGYKKEEIEELRKERVI